MILLISVMVTAQHVYDDVPIDGGPSPSEQQQPPPTTQQPPAPSTAPPTAPPKTQPFVQPDVWPSVIPGRPYTQQIGKEKVYSGYTMNHYDTKTAKPTGYTYYDYSSKPVAQISKNGYEVWDGTSWKQTNYNGMRDAIAKSQTDFANSDKVPADQRAKAVEKSKTDAEKAAKEMENQGLARGYVAVCENPWRCIGRMMKAYDQYKGIGEATAMFFPSYNEWTKEMRRTLSQTFCGFVSIQNCFESVICGAVLDISAGDSISGNVLFGRGPNGQPLAAGTISAERSLPIVLKGLERERLREIMGENVELIVVGGEVINISEVDTTTLSAAEFRLYKVQYSLTNTNDREMKYNLEFKGQTTRKFYSSDKKLNPGQTVPSDDRNIEVYSATKYDEVCMMFNPSLPAGTGSTLLVAPKMVSKLCKPIVEYAGGATSIGNYAKKANEDKKQGAPLGGFI